jgi:hypothetical protein
VEIKNWETIFLYSLVNNGLTDIIIALNCKLINYNTMIRLNHPSLCNAIFSRAFFFNNLA